MSYLDINKPKFFINELHHQDASNNLLTGYITNQANTLEAVLPIYNKPEKKYSPSDFGGYTTGGDGSECMVFSLKEGYWNDILLSEESDEYSSKYGSYLAILGTSKVNDDFYGFWGSGREFAEFGGHASYYQAIETWGENTLRTNIVNAEVRPDGICEDKVGGWILFTDLALYLPENCKTLCFWVSVPSAGQKRTIGSVSIGNYFTPNVNPDINYDIEHIQDGTRFIQTRGGATLSNSYYTGPPLWANDSAPWELGIYDSANFSIIPPSKMKRNGRRRFNFTWSGLADENLMPTNSLHSYYPDIDDISQIDDNNTIITESNTFYSQVLSKTYDKPFIFTTNGSNFTKDSFMIGRWQDNDFQFSSVANKIYSFSNSIIESW
tara:strand:- start:18999 stop:20138 length:1140 start_codon:yes stop_codon:yes gene_type:complete